MNACRRQPYVSRLSRARRFAVVPDQAGVFLKTVIRRQRSSQGIVNEYHGRGGAHNGFLCRDPGSSACVRAEQSRFAHAVHPGVESGRGRILDAVELPCNGVAGNSRRSLVVRARGLVITLEGEPDPATSHHRRERDEGRSERQSGCTTVRPATGDPAKIQGWGLGLSGNRQEMCLAVCPQGFQRPARRFLLALVNTTCFMVGICERQGPRISSMQGVGRHRCVEVG